MQRQLNTLIERIEYMATKLGGDISKEFDGSSAANTSSNRYYFLSEVIKENLRMIKSELDNREDIINDLGYNSKERILADEEIKTYIDDSETTFKELK